MNAGISRRRVLGLLAGSPLLGANLGSAAAAATRRTTSATTAAAAPAQTAPGPILKPLPPEWFVVHGTNAETRWEALRDVGFTVPNDRFFVRNHTATPLIDAATWRLRLFGSGLRRGPVELTYDDLLAMPARTTTAVIECAGNGRRFFADQQGTPAGGTPWRLGAVGAARWKGVPLADVLRRAGLRRSAVDVLPEGLDATVVSGGVDQAHVRRPLPIAKALDDDVLLAYEMNGEPLPPDHGFPVRLVVPGWVGIASIKWLGQIEVADHPLFSPWNTTLYRMTGPTYPPDSPPLGEQPVKSAFELPWAAELPSAALPSAQLPAAAPTPARRHAVLHGRSWSGHAPIRRVDVSLDGGATWQPAQLRPGDGGQAWTRWHVPWSPRPGAYELLARATDRRGNTQPDAVPFNDGGYQFGAVVRHPVTVTAS